MSVITYTVETYKNGKHVNTSHEVRGLRVRILLECWECLHGDSCDMMERFGVCREAAAWENLNECKTHNFKDHLGTLWCIRTDKV